MTAYAFAGTLHRDPVMRTAKTGNAFVTALLRSESQGETWGLAVVRSDSVGTTHAICRLRPAVGVNDIIAKINCDRPRRLH
jgi:hypothetical protein